MVGQLVVLCLSEGLRVGVDGHPGQPWDRVDLTVSAARRAISGAQPWAWVSGLVVVRREAGAIVQMSTWAARQDRSVPADRTPAADTGPKLANNHGQGPAIT